MFAQTNLIPNASLEEYNFLMLYKSQNGEEFNKALPYWFSPLDNRSTPDFISPKSNGAQV